MINNYTAKLLKGINNIELNGTKRDTITLDFPGLSERKQNHKTQAEHF